MPKEISGDPPPNVGRKNIKIWTTLSEISALNTAYLLNETSHRQPKTLVSMCPLKVDLLSVTFDPETAEIRLLIVTQHSAVITLQPSKLRYL